MCAFKVSPKKKVCGSQCHLLFSQFNTDNLSSTQLNQSQIIADTIKNSLSDYSIFFFDNSILQTIFIWRCTGIIQRDNLLNYQKG